MFSIGTSDPSTVSFSPSVPYESDLPATYLSDLPAAYAIAQGTGQAVAEERSGYGGGHGGGGKGTGTACIVKGSYCNCHYCKCEQGHISCGGHGGYGEWKRQKVLSSFKSPVPKKHCKKLLPLI